MQKLYFFLALTLVIVSCKQDTQQEEPKSYFCSPQLEAFFSGADSLPVIEFKHTDTVTVFLEKLYKVIDTPCYYANFRIPFILDSNKTALPLKVSVSNLPFPSPIICGRINDEVRVYLDNDDKYLVIIDSVVYGDTSLIRKTAAKHLKNNGVDPHYSVSPKKAVFVISWSRKISRKKFDAAIKAIINGYTEVINDASFKKFNKEFCLLTPIEGGEIISQYNFNLKLRYRELEYQKFALDTMY